MNVLDVYGSNVFTFHFQYVIIARSSESDTDTFQYFSETSATTFNE